MKTFIESHFVMNLSKFMNFKQKRIPMQTFVQSKFEVRYLYEFQIKANSYEDIS